MADKQEQTTIVFSKSVTAIICCVVVVAGAMAFWKDRGGSEAAAAVTHDLRVDGHDRRLFTVEAEVKTLDKRMDGTELMQLALKKDYESLSDGQREIKEQSKKDAEIMRDQRREDAKIAREQRKEDMEVIKEFSDQILTMNLFINQLDNIKETE